MGGEKSLDVRVVALCSHHCDLPVRWVTNSFDELHAFPGKGVPNIAVNVGMGVEVYRVNRVCQFVLRKVWVFGLEL